MSVSILFFGATAAITARRQIELQVEKDTSAEHILSDIIDQYPSLAVHKLHFSINQEYASGNEVVRDGDELAIFTAVSGG